MTDILTIILLLTGSGFAFVAGIAVVRMPDLYTRMHGATKCASLGLGCIVTAVAVSFSYIGTTTRVLLTIGFIFLTAPIAAHMIGRAAHLIGVARWHGTVLDESPAGRQQKKAESPETEQHEPH